MAPRRRAAWRCTAATALDFIAALAIAQMEAEGMMEVYGCDGHVDLVDGIARAEE
jgi:hypothetical protein